eukprot:CFRG0195T1
MALLSVRFINWPTEVADFLSVPLIRSPTGGRKEYYDIMTAIYDVREALVLCGHGGPLDGTIGASGRYIWSDPDRAWLNEKEVTRPTEPEYTTAEESHLLSRLSMTTAGVK